jgi:hypothetical protein
METHNLDLKLFADWPESGNLGNFSLDRVVMYSSSKGEGRLFVLKRSLGVSCQRTMFGSSNFRSRRDYRWWRDGGALCHFTTVPESIDVLLHSGNNHDQLLLRIGIGVLREVPPILGTGSRFPPMLSKGKSEEPELLRLDRVCTIKRDEWSRGRLSVAGECPHGGDR